MSYEPREGVDYLVDYYAAIGIDQNVESEDINRALKRRSAEYHPDRLEGLAPEFRSKGERMARVINRARIVLLRPEARAEYDEILKSWDGPLSNDGTPVISQKVLMRRAAEGKDPAELEEALLAYRAKVEGMVGYSPNRLAMLERLMAQLGEDEVPDDIRAEYDEALLQKDRVLAIDESQRADLLGLPSASEKGYELAEGYEEDIAGEIEAARTEYASQLRLQALGGVGARLALLAGETTVDDSEEQPASGLVAYTGVPAFFDQQADATRKLAAEREEILTKRLRNFQPTYPEAGLQTEARTTFVVGIQASQKVWFKFIYNTDEISLTTLDLDEDTRQLLDSGDFKAVIESGSNILTFAPMEQIDLKALLDEAVNKYVSKFFPEQK